MRKADFLKSTAVGVIVCSIVLISTIYSSLKSGMSAVVDTALLSVVGLTALRGLSKRNTALSDIVARASTSAASTVAVYFVTLILLEGSVSPGSSALFGVLIILSSLAGILFYATMTAYFSSESYPFPQLAPRLAVIEATESSLAKNLKFFLSTAASALYNLGAFLFPFIPKRVALGGRSIFSLEISPLLVSVGYFIGHKTYVKMGLGFLYSLAVYFLFGAAQTDFATHIMNPFIYSVVLAFSLTQGAMTIAGMGKKLRQGGPGRGRPGLNKGGMLVLLGFFLLNCLFFSQAVPTGYTLPVWIFLLLIPLTILSSLSTLISVAETGFWFSYLEDLLPIIILLLASGSSIGAIAVAICGLTAFEMSGVYYMINYRVAREFGVPKRSMTLGSMASAVAGGVVCIAFVALLGQSMGFGGLALPSPNSQVFRMTLEGLSQAIGSHMIPSYLSPAVFAVACAACVLLKRGGVSPMIIVGGILLPFGVFLIMGAGALTRFFAQRKGRDLMPVFSGVSVGEGLSSALYTMFHVFL